MSNTLATREVRLLARLGAVEFLIENVYAVALTQCVDPVGAARRWAAEVSTLARQATIEATDVDRVVGETLITGLAEELDAIFGRIVRRVENHARRYPTADEA
ncbi:MAG: hypothetical protein ACE5H8_02080 [Alphaproteobacteria bacterium]